MASLLDSMKGAFTGFFSRFGGLGLSRFRVLLPGSRFDYEREAGDLWNSSVVAIAIKWKGDRYAKSLVRVSKVMPDGDYEPVGRHDMTDLWNRPNPSYGRRTLEKAIGLSLDVDGNAYVYKVRARSRRVVELWWIPHDRILPMWPADGSEFISGYLYRVDGNYYELPREDVIHVRDGIDPRNERLGLAATKAQLREVVTLNEESIYTASILRNLGVPGLMVVPASDQLRPNAADADRIKDRVRDAFTGDNRGEAIVLGGNYSVSTVGFSPEQLRLDRLPAMALARVAAALGVAPMSLGLPDPQKTYANLAEANRASWGTITATQDIVADALRWQLLADFEDPHAYVFEYVYDHIAELQEDLAAKSTRVCGEWTAGLRSQNEAREELGLEPADDGERYFPGTTGPETPDFGPPPELPPGLDAPDLEEETLKEALGLMRSIKGRLDVPPPPPARNGEAYACRH